MLAVYFLLLPLLLVAATDLLAQSLGGTLYAGGNWADRNGDAPVLAAGDLLELPKASAQATLQLLPQFDLGVVQVEAELWGELIAAQHAEPDLEGQIQRLTGEYSLGSSWLTSLGARVFHSGTAYVWNPSNPFTDPNVNNLDRSYPYHRKGDPFAAVEWLGVDDSVAVQLVDWLPTDPLYGPDIGRETSVAVRWEHIFESADVTAVLARRDDENFASLAGSMAIGESLELHTEAAVHDRRRTLLPFSRSEALPGGETTLHELAATDENATGSQALAGGQYTFSNQTNIIFEYFYNGEGYSDREFDDLQSAVADASLHAQDPILGDAQRGFIADVAGISGRMRRHYLFGRLAMADLYKDLDVQLFVSWGIEDSAKVSGLLATLPVSNVMMLRASLEHFGGPDDSEIAFIPYRWRGSLALTLSF